MPAHPFHFPKPVAPVWDRMPLYRKIRYYGRHLTRDYAPYVDKLDAKTHAQRLCPEIGIPRVLKVFRPEDYVRSSDIPPRAFFKASHGCGWNIPTTTDTRAALLNSLKRSWTRIYGHNEKQYTFLTPRFFFEEQVEITLEIKVMCIYGRPIFILVEQESTSFYLDTTWSFVWQAHDPVSRRRHKNPSLPPRPSDLHRLLDYAERLSAPFECVRIDVYMGENEMIYFSEFTFTHAAGLRRLEESLEIRFGRAWTHT